MTGSANTKYDVKREHPELYAPSAKEFAIVDVPPMRFLAVDGQTELSRINLHHLGIIRVAPTEGSGSAIARVTAELYCEEMELDPPGGNP